MTVQRELWAQNFTEWPVWPCPRCGTQSLVIDKPTLAIRETGASKRDQQHEAWEPTWMDRRFTAQLVCGIANCGEVVAVAGRCAVAGDGYYYAPDDESGEQYWDVFSPKFFVLTPPVFSAPIKCPATVSIQLDAAFSLMWADIGASANRLRCAVEALLTEQGVRRTQTGKSGGRKPLSLHARIEVFKVTHLQAADTLLAIKWLGNDGSHAGLNDLTLDALLDGFELFEHVLDMLYVKHGDRMKKLAASINKRKGPRQKKPRPKKRALSVPGFE